MCEHQLETVIQTMQTGALELTKLSVLFFYRRIFCTSKSGLFNPLSQTMVALTSLWTVTVIIGLVFGCDTVFYALWGYFGLPVRLHHTCDANTKG